MGSFANCCKRADNPEEKNIITNNNIILLPKYNNNNKNRGKNYSFLKNHSLNIKNIIISDDKTQNTDKDIKKENNTEISIKDNEKEKIIKIQQKYRSYIFRNKFIKEIKPSLEKQSTNFINKLYNQLSLGGKISIDNDDFSVDGWKRYYPSDESFFLYSKGKVFSNQIISKNLDNPQKLEIYEGETNYENLKHGFGILTTPHYILKGSWRKGEFTGWGRKYLENGDIYEGKFINGEINGKGNYINKDKNTFYVGDFVNGQCYGKGDLTTEKYHYKGDFKNNKFDGYGIIEFLNEGHRYEGYFEKNIINGKGVYKWKNGDIYEGDMKNGKMNGKGKYTYIDGKIYEGEYINGIKEGKGKLFYPDGKCFDGNFKNGVPHGEGFCTKNGKTNKVLFNQGEYIRVK